MRISIGESDTFPGWTKGRKRVLGIKAAILASLHMQTADDLFGGPQGQSPDGQVDSSFSSMGSWDHAED